MLGGMTTIIVDSREQTPWTAEGLGCPTVRAKLDAGDYSVEGLEGRVAIERKSLDDWCGTITRERKRFYRELDLLRAFEFRCVIIEGSIRDIMGGRYTSQTSPKTVLAFVAEIAVAQCVPVYLGGSRPESQILAGAFLRMAAKKLGQS